MLMFPKWLSFCGDHIIKKSFSGDYGNSSGCKISGTVDFVAHNGDVDSSVSSLRGVDSQHQAIIRDLFIFGFNNVEDTKDDIVPGDIYVSVPWESHLMLFVNM